MSLSVVIATLNSARTIGRCLASLAPYQEQGYIAEVTVVDGRSSDGTAETVSTHPVKLLVEQGAERYEKSLIRKRQSLYNALELGWRHSSGELVMFLDSDAYLGENFFPLALEFFLDPSLGVLGCWSRGWATTPLARTIGELWRFHGERISAFQAGSRNPLERLYQFSAGFGKVGIPTSGPCYIVRRRCLELLGGHNMQGDVGIALRLQAKGFRPWWWVEAPVYHLPKESFVELAKQRYVYGQEGAYISDGRPTFYLSLLLRSIGAIGLGVFLAVRFRNALHLLALPVAEASHLAGYLHGRWARACGRR